MMFLRPTPSASMTKNIRILYLEDRPEDMELVKDLLDREYFPCELLWVSTRAAYLSALREPWSFDLILADYFLPDIGGDEALEQARKLAPTLPFVFLSGSLGEERAVECLRRGATDYVFKNNLPRLNPVLRRALEEARQAEARREAEAANARVAALLRATLESTGEGLLIVDLAGRISAYNRKFLGLFGIPEYIMAHMDLEEVVQYLTDQFQDPNALLEEVRLLRSRSEKETSGVLSLHGRALEQSGRPHRVGTETVGRVLSVRELPDGQEALQGGFVEGLRGLGDAILSGRAAPWHLIKDRLIIPDSGLGILGLKTLPQSLPELVELIHPEDTDALLEALERAQSVSFKIRVRQPDASWRWIRWNLDRCPKGYRGLFMDSTELAWQERRARQRHGRDATRDTAGRLAGKFAGWVEAAREDLAALAPEPGQQPGLNHAMERLGALDRGLAQLRAYAGLGRPALVEVQPNEFMEALLPEFRAEMGPDSILEFQPGTDLPALSLDPAQIRQALGELLRNARQAGPGRIRLGTGLLQPRPHRPGSLPGARRVRVWFEVHDTGPGIPADQQEQIFEPFFSTRPEPECHGLGLARVQAIVEGHRGSVQVQSTPGQGTTLRLLLPV